MHASFLRSLTAAILLAAVLFVGAAGQALAHAQLIASDPPDGAVLPQEPPTLTLKFSEPVRPLVARLTEPGGSTRVLADIGTKGTTVVLTLPAGLGQGTHILSWRVASSDGHPIGGGLLFSIGAASATAPGATEQADLSVRIGLWAARFLVIAGLVFGVGGAVFRSLAHAASSPEPTPLVSAALLAGLIGAIVLVPLQGLDALGAPFAAAFEMESWKAGLWATSYGRATLLAATALLLAFASLQINPSRTALLISALALLAAGFAFAAAGHAASAPPRWLMAPAVFVHAVAVLLWLGALAPLGVALARGGAEAVRPLAWFSKTIPAVIAALLVSGAIIAVVQVQTPAALISSDYGRVLLVKLALVAVMLLLATVNRYLLTRPATAGDKVAKRHLSQNIAAEIVLGIAVIGVLGLWRFTPPPRAVAPDPARFEVQSVQATNGDVTALLSIHPPIAGPARIEVTEITVGGKPRKPLGVSVELGKPSYGIGPFTKDAVAAADGVYHADGYLLPLDGFWVVKVTILVSDFRSVTLTDVFDVRKATD
ncbi:CopD family protein [Mesorhizobium sp. LHD-90]|uniref:copper resistance CopC/CopD family protein n=1 Tax=Mesorhizobium sp. LHD-90 TaxID=3071414 RepID=UPI0027E1DB06|nr:CopD family protein [Mesorhizobium sp. LHD-90]MDQ6433889.1 CopD family protein [Mesorhizobium sp. LHD-90]